MKPLNSSKPHLIITVGIPGSGKSHFAEHFAETFRAPMISFDQIRNKTFGNIECDDKQKDVISRLTDHLLDEVLKTGRTVVYDGPTNLRVERGIISKKARDCGYDPLFVWIQTETHTAKKRATKKNRDKTALSSEQYDLKIKKFSAPHLNERAVVISGKHTYPSQLKIVLKNLVQPRTPAIEGNEPPATKRFWVR